MKQHPKRIPCSRTFADNLGILSGCADAVWFRPLSSVASHWLLTRMLASWVNTNRSRADLLLTTYDLPLKIRNRLILRYQRLHDHPGQQVGQRADREHNGVAGFDMSH